MYEMATGKRAFEGSSAASLIAAILEREPPAMSTLQPVIPPALDHVIRRCLVKDPDSRWQSAMDIVHELQWILETRPSAGSADSADLSRRPWVWMTVAAVCLVAVAALSVIHFREAQPFQPVLRYAIPLPKEGQSEGVYFNFHISPDGRFIAASAVLEQTLGIFVRALDSSEFRVLAGTDNSDFFWSPDSRYIGFFDLNDRKVKKVKVSGGPPEEICDVGPGFLYDAHGSWGRDDVILFAPPGGGPLVRVPATGGQARPVTMAGEGISHTYPVFLPDGQHFLYTSRGGTNPGIYVASFDSPAGRRPLGAWFRIAHSKILIERAVATSGGMYDYLDKLASTCDTCTQKRRPKAAAEHRTQNRT